MNKLNELMEEDQSLAVNEIDNIKNLSDEVIKLYSSPYFLWGVCFVLLYWITRIIFTASTGLMHLDPIIYASKDKISYICLIIILFFITASII